MLLNVYNHHDIAKLKFASLSSPICHFFTGIIKQKETKDVRAAISTGPYTVARYATSGLLSPGRDISGQMPGCKKMQV